ncbi:MAG: hypothetical protein KDE28_13865, partial [Anaerolineales bacterium]|nr:hypothetical protein [Anaerolineales bacterium]
DGANEYEIEAELARAWLVDRAWSIAADWAWDWLVEIGTDEEDLADKEDARRRFVNAWLSDNGYDLERLELDEVYTRQGVAAEWLRMREYDPELVFLSNDPETHKSQWQQSLDYTIEVCVREWYHWLQEK